MRRSSTARVMCSSPTTATSSFETLPPPPPPPPQAAANRTSGMPSSKKERRLMSGCRVAAASVRTGRFEARRIGDLGGPRSAADRVREQLIAERLPHAGLGQAGCAGAVSGTPPRSRRTGVCFRRRSAASTRAAADRDPEPLRLELEVLAVDQQGCGGALELVVGRRPPRREGLSFWRRTRASCEPSSAARAPRVIACPSTTAIAPGGTFCVECPPQPASTATASSGASASHAACSASSSASTSPSASRKSSWRSVTSRFAEV